MKRICKQWLMVIIALLMLMNSTVIASGSITGSDISGHWAEQDLIEWQQKQLISPVDDIRPDEPITRAELIEVINRLFNFQHTTDISFIDISELDESYDAFRLAVAAGIIEGYEDGTVRPKASITREELAVIIFRLFELEVIEEQELSLTDLDSLSDWSAPAVGTLVHMGMIHGYPDGTFRGKRQVTRAEMVRMLKNIAGEVFNSPGVYADFTAKQALVNTADVHLKDAHIEGDLWLTEGIAEGDVVLENVTVDGAVRVAGGGMNSISILNSQISELVINKKTGDVRIVIAGHTDVEKTIVLSGVRLETAEDGLDGSGFGHVIIDEQLAEDAVVQLLGTFDHVEVRALTEAVIQLIAAVVNMMTIHEKTALHVDTGSQVSGLDIQGTFGVDITGYGRVTYSNVESATKVTFIDQPTLPPSQSPGEDEPEDPTFSGFTNASVHDPSIIKVADTYYVFGSHLAAAKSTDLINWEKFADGVHPANPLFEDVTVELAETLAWAQSDTLWAPDVIQLPDGKFYMYYNSCEGSTPRSAMGVAVADHIEGPYVDKGIFLKSGMWDEISEDGENIYDPVYHPNVVDPHVFFDAEGKLWMVYGSFSGGIFILEMDPETGFPLEGQGYGKKLIGGNHTRIEGPYIQYDAETEFYYLFVSFGGLGRNDGYNMRVFRSESPDGPYFDPEERDVTEVKSSLHNDAGVAPYGLKQSGNFAYSNLNGLQSDGVYGYVSSGHNSTYYDVETGKLFNIFHTRFPTRGEAHEIRVHQMVMNEQGWPILLPFRYTGETLREVRESDVIGSYHLINHGKDTTSVIKPSVYIELVDDGSIKGDIDGSWQLNDDYKVKLSIDGESYDGVFIRQWHEERAAYVMAFAAISNKGVTLWGSAFQGFSFDPITALNDVMVVDTDLSLQTHFLPEKYFFNEIIWTSSDEDLAIVSDTGLVKGMGAGDVTITATSGHDTSQSVSFDIIVTAEVVDVGAIKLPFDEKKLAMTLQFTPEAEVLPREALNKELIWSSSDESVAVVHEHTGTVKALNTEGTATITAAAADGSGVTQSYTLTVYDGLVAHFTFDDENLADATGHFGSGIVTGDRINTAGGHITYSAGAIGKAAVFDGHSGVLLPEGLIKSNNYSVALWVNPEQLTYFTTTFFGAKNSDSWISLLPRGLAPAPGDPERFNTMLWSGINWYDADTHMKLGTNQWTHLAFTVIEGDVKVYINGWLAFTGSNFPNIFTDEQGTFSLGVNWWDTPFKGMIDEVMVYERVLTVEEIESLVDEYVDDSEPALEEGLIAYYAFEDNLDNDVNNEFGSGEVIGKRIDIEAGGSISYSGGIEGQAAVFNGASGIRLPDGLISDHSYSVSFWIHPNELPNFTPTFFGSQSGGNWISFVPGGHADLGSTAMLWSGAAPYYDGFTSIKLETDLWTHITFTVHEGQAVVYIDGKREFIGFGFPDVFTTNNGVFSLGVNLFDDAPFKGMIDELRIYDRLLTAKEAALLAGADYVEPEPDLEEGLVAHYAFEEDLIDSTGTFASGTATGDKIQSVEIGEVDYAGGISGNAVKLDGGTGILLPEGLISSEDYSVSLWVNPDQLTDFTTLFFGAANVGQWISLMPAGFPGTNNTMVWAQWREIEEVDDEEEEENEVEKNIFVDSWHDLGIGEWTHLAYTVESGTVTLYINGVIRAQSSGLIDLFSEGEGIFTVGVNWWDVPFKGMVDELRIYNRPLIEAEVAMLANES